jgi:hypothetical protein
MSLPPSAGRLYLPILETAAKRDAMASNRDKRTLQLIERLLTLGSNLKVWEKPAGEIREALKNEFPGQKPPSPTSLGSAIRDFKDALEEKDFLVRWRSLNNKSLYIIAPRWIVEQVDAGDLQLHRGHDGEVAILIEDTDPEAVPDDWSPEDDNRWIKVLRDEPQVSPIEMAKALGANLENSG